MIIDKEIAIKLAPREDGGLRIWSDDIPGLILSGKDQRSVLDDLPIAIRILKIYNDKGDCHNDDSKQRSA